VQKSQEITTSRICMTTILCQPLSLARRPPPTAHRSSSHFGFSFWGHNFCSLYYNVSSWLTLSRGRSTPSPTPLINRSQMLTAVTIYCQSNNLMVICLSFCTDMILPRLHLHDDPSDVSTSGLFSFICLRSYTVFSKGDSLLINYCH
jgi:hypothetical protein